MKKSIFVFALAMYSVFMPLVAQEQKEDPDVKYAAQLVKPGQQAPDFTMKTLDGKDFNFKSTCKGKYIVLDFWASWCPDCIRDIPHIQRLYKEYSPKGVQFVGISMDTDREVWAAAVKKHDIAYTQVSELVKFRETEISKKYGVQWIPSMYLIAPDGKVVLGTVVSEKLEQALKNVFANGKCAKCTKKCNGKCGTKCKKAGMCKKASCPKKK